MTLLEFIHFMLMLVTGFDDFLGACRIRQLLTEVEVCEQSFEI